MNAVTAAMIAVPLAYLVGSLPFGLLTGKLVAGVDIRTQGSGNIGATNVARVLGARWGIIVLLLDALKGLLPVLVLPWLLVPTDDSAFTLVKVLCAVATICGHMFPCWLKFRGGKGVATSLGAITILGWQATLAATVVFAVVFALSRIVSLSSITAAVAFAGAELWWLGNEALSNNNWSLTAFSVLVPLLIVIRHRENVARLLRGEEKQFHAGSKQRPSAAEGKASTISAGCLGSSLRAPSKHGSGGEPKTVRPQPPTDGTTDA